MAIEITEAMIDAGIDALMEYECGEMMAEDMVKNVFVSMLSASALYRLLDAKDGVPIYDLTSLLS